MGESAQLWDAPTAGGHRAEQVREPLLRLIVTYSR
jgi:hypothetical protein